MAGRKMHWQTYTCVITFLSADPVIYMTCRGLDCSPLSEGNRDGGSLTVCADLHGQCSCKPQCCREVMAKYPRIIATNCAAHCINLLFKDVCSISVFAEVLAMVNSVVVFMHRPTKVRRLFQAKYSTLEVLKPGATRFGS